MHESIKDEVTPRTNTSLSHSAHESATDATRDLSGAARVLGRSPCVLL